MKTSLILQRLFLEASRSLKSDRGKEMYVGRDELMAGSIPIATRPLGQQELLWFREAVFLVFSYKSKVKHGK